VIHSHPTIPWLSATIEFLPSRTLTLTKGTFLVTLNEAPSSGKTTTITQRLDQLSRREKECAWMAAEGLHNDEIAKRLGKSQITVRNQLTAVYRKLGLKSRHKLIAEFSRIDPRTQKKLKIKR
jgi:DNA-binding CsgD family transcriptional regulator